MKSCSISSFAATAAVVILFASGVRAEFQGYNSLELAGRLAASIPVETVDGKDTELRFGGQQTVIYVVAPRTGWVQRNAPNIKALWQARQGQYRFIGLSLRKPGLEAELKSAPLPFPVFIAKNYRDPKLAAYGFGAVPALYLIDENSKIARAWGGALTGPAQADAEKFFSVKLPGVTPGIGEFDLSFMTIDHPRTVTREVRPLGRPPFATLATGGDAALVQSIPLRDRENGLSPNRGHLASAEARGLVTSEWGTSENNRRAKFYCLTPMGRKQLEVEQADWDRLRAAVAEVLPHA